MTADRVPLGFDLQGFCYDDIVMLKVLGQYHKVLMQATVAFMVVQDFLIIGFRLFAVFKCTYVGIATGC